MTDRSAPGFIVTVVGESNNEERVTDQSHRIIALTYTDSERQADKVVLEVENFQLQNFDDQIWAKGNRVRVQWGYPSAMAPVRECVITKVTGFASLKIEARAESVLMNRETKRRTFENRTRSEVVRDIATENGYAAAAQDIQTTSIRYPVITQANLTDAQFLRRLAHRQGYEFFVDFDGLHWHERRLDQPPLRRFTYYTDPGKGDVLSMNIESDLTARPARTRLVGRDPLTRQDVEVSADGESDQDRATLGEIAINLDFERAEVAGVTRIASEETQPHVDASSPEGGSEQAGETAKGRFRRTQRLLIKGSMSIIGDPNLLAKSIVEVGGIGIRLSGLWYVKEVTHKLGPNGYIADVKMVKDAHNGYQRRRRRQDNGLPQVGRPRTGGRTNTATASEEGSPNERSLQAEPVTTITPDFETATLPAGAVTRRRYVDRRQRDSRTGQGGNGGDS